MRVRSTLPEPSVVRTILSHLGVRADPLPLAPARDPTGQAEVDFDAASPTTRRPSPRTRAAVAGGPDHIAACTGCAGLVEVIGPVDGCPVDREVAGALHAG